MNNAKVRIYELSKELNLDNKDLLEICEQLNIAVKSHSSTITEDQAERIKATAAKYFAHPTTSKASGNLTAQKGVKTGERKQQILAIHKHNRPDSAEDWQNSIQSPTLASPPRPPVGSQDDTSFLTPEVPPLLEDSSTEKDNGMTKLPVIPQNNQSSQQPILETETLKASTSQPESSKLLTPSPRHSSTKKSSPETPHLLRTNSAEPVKSAPAAMSTATGTVEKPRKEKLDKIVDKPNKPIIKTDVRSPKPSDTPKETVELKRPVRPASPQKKQPIVTDIGAIPEDADLLEKEGSETDDDLDVSLIAKPKSKIKRTFAAPGRSAKKGKEEEDDRGENRDKTGKASKNTGKNKRKSQVLFEEEDLEADLEDSEISPIFSLSTARPPKPKSTAKPAAPVSTITPTAAKAKKTSKPEMSAARAKAEKLENQEEQRPESVVLEGSLTVRELSELMKVPETEIIKNLFFKGIPVNITQTLDVDTIHAVAEDFTIKIETPTEKAAATKTTEMIDAADLEYLLRRPPVVTIMGHVDHGKTTLLDSIRQTKVAQGEAGGITQHIGAYHVDVEHNDKPEQIVFLDTPGHEAFTAMRARGARVTDIAILVVAADDGVQPQTKEAISHARAAGVPIVVAINKVDKPEANPDRIKQELADQGLLAEEWGGDTIMVPVSALKGENLDGLLEMILLVAEIEELSANPDRLSRGTVIEANLDRTRGPVATLLVQNGTLRVGDTIVAGSVLGKIRAMIDDRGDKVEAASPSFAVEVLGLNDVPEAGDEFEVFANEKEARQTAENRSDDKRQSRLQQAMSSRRVSLSTLSAQAQEGKLKELNLIIKADVQGSVEAIFSSLNQLPQNEVQIRILLAAPGEVTETDVDLAAASGAVIVGFNTTLASGARAAADREGVDIREYNIIYKLLDDIQGAMEGLLDPEEIEEALGQAEVRAVFPVGRGAVAGCYVLSGKLVRNRFLRVRRKGEVIYTGVLDSLKRMKEDAREVNAGYECGIGVSKFNAWEEGDIIEAYEMVMKRRTLSSN